MSVRPITFLFSVFAITILLWGCTNTADRQPVNYINPITVYFTPGTECEDNIIAEINHSNKIDIAVYSITNPQIGNAIINAHKRGAHIRIITDRTQSRGKSALTDKFTSAGIPLITNKKHKIEHNKFAIFDNNRIVSGSYNWTTNASKYNSENCIFFYQPNQEYTTRFEQLWQMYNK